MVSQTVADKNIRVGDTLVLNIHSHQLGEQIAHYYGDSDEAIPMPKGTNMTVDSIVRYPDGVHFDFETKFGPVTIYKFALENMFNDGNILIKE